MKKNETQMKKPRQREIKSLPTVTLQLDRRAETQTHGRGESGPTPLPTLIYYSLWSKIFKWRTGFPPLPKTYGSSFETSVIPENTGNHWCFSVAGPRSPLKNPMFAWKPQEWRQPQRHPGPPQSLGFRKSEHARRKPVGRLRYERRL